MLSSRTTATEENIDVADELLREFVVYFTTFYEKEFLRYNVHSLLHLSAEVRLHGPLDTYSAYKFEDKIRQLKRMIKSNNRVPEQLFNRIKERQKINYIPKRKDKSSMRSILNKRDSCFVLKGKVYSRSNRHLSAKGWVHGIKIQYYTGFFHESILFKGFRNLHQVDKLNDVIEFIHSYTIKFKCNRLPYQSPFVAIPRSIHSEM